VSVRERVCVCVCVYVLISLSNGFSIKQNKNTEYRQKKSKNNDYFCTVVSYFSFVNIFVTVLQNFCKFCEYGSTELFQD